MESLRYDDVEKQYPEVLEKLQATYPDSVFSGKAFEISSDEEQEIVFLKIGDDKIHLTRQQALDLSYALSREAKRIVKKQRKMRG